MAAARELLLHGTAIAVGGRAVIFIGPPGSGKSDLALRCILGSPLSPLFRDPARLVSDDQVMLRANGPRIMVSAPPSIVGKLEVRGVGICDMSALASPDATLTIVLDLDPGKTVERLPEPAVSTEFFGLPVHRYNFRPFEASAVQKVMLLLGLKSEPRHGRD